MIRSVTFEGSTWAALPHKFEAGTPNIEGAVGLAAAVAYLEAIGLDVVAAHEHALVVKAEAALRAVPDVRIVGTPRERAAVISFLVADVHPHDIGTVLDRHGVAVRAGHHCAQPVMERLGVHATVRASFAAYSSPEDVEALLAGLHEVRRMFA
jgi:cysteine desulfurase/selenocysteine lyase